VDPSLLRSDPDLNPGFHVHSDPDPDPGSHIHSDLDQAPEPNGIRIKSDPT